mmetsp:Transcript_115548/g.326641  ORF Transcript_115548/g.326641 Transcript_115548/m.326641 type:complete len:200 (+) Transcript_115548:1289-1888(+)
MAVCRTTASAHGQGTAVAEIAGTGSARHWALGGPARSHGRLRPRLERRAQGMHVRRWRDLRPRRRARGHSRLRIILPQQLSQLADDVHEAWSHGLVHVRATQRELADSLSRICGPSNTPVDHCAHIGNIPCDVGELVFNPAIGVLKRRRPPREEFQHNHPKGVHLGAFCDLASTDVQWVGVADGPRGLLHYEGFTVGLR